MLETRPVSMAYMAAASLRLVVELLGKLVVSNSDVAPLLIGSFVLTPKVTVEKDELLWCTPKGQVADLKSGSVFSYTAEKAKGLLQSGLARRRYP